MLELEGKIVVFLDLKSSAHYFFQVLGKEAHRIPGKATDKLHAVDVHEGDWKTTGSLKKWTYTINGKVEEFHERMELDEKNYTVTLTGKGGHALEQYKKYGATFVFAPKEDGSSKVTITLFYEKKKAEDPRPNHYMDFVISFVRDIDAHLITN